jgi:NADH dehydrogenase
VVVIGGGFGGLAAARKLRHADVDVTLVDRNNHHLFQPLLYQVAAGALSPSDCASPIRPYLKHSDNATVLMAEVTEVDPERRQVVLDRGDRLDYDSLLVVGGGPTGVEIAGELAITARTLRGAFRRIDSSAARVILLDAGERVVAAFSPRLSSKVADNLADLGVTVLEGARVTDIDERGVTYEADGESKRIDARTVVWAAGVHPVALVDSLARVTGAETDRSGRIKVGPDLTIPGHPEISVVGDVACLDAPGGKPLPGLATVAIQQAHHVARGIHAGGVGASTPFKYLDKGALAVVGRGRAVCEIRGLRFSGRPAFLTYAGVHLFYLGGQMGRRLEVMFRWVGARFGERQSALIEGELASVERASRAAEATQWAQTSSH